MQPSKIVTFPQLPRKRRQPAALGLEQTHIEAAELFVKANRDQVRYCDPWGKWLVWTGQRWQLDQTQKVQALMKGFVADLYQDAVEAGDVDRMKWVRSCTSASARQAILRTAQSEPCTPVLPDQLDTDPWLLNVANGTIDLRTGNLRPHRQEDRITKLAPVAYDPEAECPTWLAFLERVLAGNRDMIGFLRRAVGYSLTGTVGERVLFVLYGEGANGKSTFLEVLMAVLGDYAGPAAPGLLLARSTESHPTDMADLFGRRMATSVETGEGRRFDEARVKWLTGGDLLKARRMREDFWTFVPTHKLWLATNHKPVIRGTDQAIWDRLRLIPFTVRIPERERDKTLKHKLLAEAPGILAWAVQGCLEWQQSGLGEPPEVVSATAGYREEMDTLGAFITERCIASPSMTVRCSALYAEYKRWAEETGEYPLSQRALSQRLQERGFRRVETGHAKVWCWQGLGLVTR